MNFFLQTASQIFKAFFLIIKGDEKANDHIAMSEAHFMLSWLMVIVGSFIYMLYLPGVFDSDAAQEILPKDASYLAFKSANMISLIFNLLAGYVVIYLLAKPLEYSGSVLRYIISQNWVFLITIVLLVPLSTSTSALEEGSPLVSLLIFIFLFILFFAYRTLKIILGINGPKAFMILLVLLFIELVTDKVIDGWFGLIVVS